MEILRHANPDILIATHSPEIISEVDSGDLLVVNKAKHSAIRIKSAAEIQSVLSVLGSNMNATLTLLAKSKKAIFVEGKDFSLLAAFARRLGKHKFANGSGFAVIPVRGFNPVRARDLSEGMEKALGGPIRKALVLDRDYRPNQEVENITAEFSAFMDVCRIHSRKEIENFLLVPTAIQRAVEKRIAERRARGRKIKEFGDDAATLLFTITEDMKNDVNAQVIERQVAHIKTTKPHLDRASIHKEALDEFDRIWANDSSRIAVIPGKAVLSRLNAHLQEHYSVSLTPKQIVQAMHLNEIPEEIHLLLETLERFIDSN